MKSPRGVADHVHTYEKISLPTSPPHTYGRPARTCLQRTTAQQVQIKMKTGLSNVGGAVEAGGRDRWGAGRVGAC